MQEPECLSPAERVCGLYLLYACQPGLGWPCDAGRRWPPDAFRHILIEVSLPSLARPLPMALRSMKCIIVWITACRVQAACARHRSEQERYFAYTLLPTLEAAVFNVRLRVRLWRVASCTKPRL